MTKLSETEKAANLIKETAEATAMSLNIQYIQKDITEIKQSVKDLANKDSNYVSKEDFTFWRNLLVSGMLLTIFVGIITNYIRQ